MENNGIIKAAIEHVSKAIAFDNEQKFEEAFNSYKLALDHFTTGLKYEKNETRKKLIMERLEGYMKRAEELRDYLNKQAELGSGGGKGSVGGMAGTKKPGDEDEDQDTEKKKLRGALSGAIVTEKPNVLWTDVAGLEVAKDSLKEVSVNGSEGSGSFANVLLFFCNILLSMTRTMVARF